MAEVDLTSIAGASIATPASGVVALYNETDKLHRAKDANGYVHNLSQFVNFSTTSQTPTIATRQYIVGSQVALPAAGRLQIGTILRWRFNVTKTATGSAGTGTFEVAFGTAGTTSDTSRLTFSRPGTPAANADDCFVVIEAIVRGPLSASGIVTGQIVLYDNQTGAGGFLASGKYIWTATVQSAAFDVTTPTFVGCTITSATSEAVTIQQVVTEVFNL